MSDSFGADAFDAFTETASVTTTSSSSASSRNNGSSSDSGGGKQEKQQKTRTAAAAADGDVDFAGISTDGNKTKKKKRKKSKKRVAVSEEKTPADEAEERDRWATKVRVEADRRARYAASDAAAAAAFAAADNAAGGSSSSSGSGVDVDVDTTSKVLGASTVAVDAEKSQASLFGEYRSQEVIKETIHGDDGKTCMTERAYPPAFDVAAYTLAQQANPWNAEGHVPAKQYPFVLDLFQQRAIACIEQSESVLVAAHTSAGKTVCAEYAIALALREGQRVIYTSPIKALSNQKYRELYEEFQDVGLMTGDITINPSASCLVMTTEILRNMLYRGSEVMREVAWVVFDEIHYMRDKERGVVWEETLILLPHTVRYVFLSATIPNAAEFAMWIAKLHDHVCNVVYTEYRPTPLQHFVFPGGGDGLYMVVDDKRKFLEANFQKALAKLSADGDDDAGVDDGSGGSKKGAKKKRPSAGNANTSSDMFKIVRMIMDRKYSPVIIFSFSKRECEQNAMKMISLDFCDDDERKLTDQIFSNAIDSLCDDDKKLPAVLNILPLLRRGIGIHHGGLLPILKEVIEILFQEGLIKCLFATETFAMGLNMPAKTVVFTSVNKFDGEKMRPLSPGEYIQMSGRAGRRGLDKRGIVIMMMDSKLEPDVAKNMIMGQSDPLVSSFHLGYNMLLNLLRVEEADPEYMMARSFRQFQQTRQAPKLEAECASLCAERDAIVVQHVKSVADYYRLRSALQRLCSQVRAVIARPLHILPFLNSGRLVRVRVRLPTASEVTSSSLSSSQGQEALVMANGAVDDAGASDYGWGVIISFKKERKDGGGSGGGRIDDVDAVYSVDVVLHCDAASAAHAARVNKEAKRAAQQGARGGGPRSKRTPPPPTMMLPLPYVPSVTSTDSSDKSSGAAAAGAAIGKQQSKKKKTDKKAAAVAAAVATNKGVYVRVTITLDMIDGLSAVRVVVSKDISSGSSSSSNDGVRKLGRSVTEVQRRFPDGVPLLDPVEDMKIDDAAFIALLRRQETAEHRVHTHKCHVSATRDADLAQYARRLALDTRITAVRAQISAVANDIVLKAKLTSMKRVLRRLGCCTDDNVIDMKGRVACEISTCDELVITELIFNGTFNALAPAQIVSLVSAMVFQERCDDESQLVKTTLAVPFRAMQDAARRVGQVSIDAKLQLDIEEYVGTIKPELIDVVHSWCMKSKFSEICKMSSVFEGSIIRCMRRLEEALRQLATAAKTIGNEELEAKVDAGIKLIKRDIIFAASLYL